MLTALVLLATPLHDPGPPAPRGELAAPLRGAVPTPEPGIAERGSDGAALPRAVAKRQPPADDGVPAVIYETRRIVHRSRGARASQSDSEPITFAAATGRREPHATPASLAPQSP